MKIPKTKSITELRSSLFETFEEVISGEIQLVTHKNGKMVALISIDQIKELYDQIDLHKNLSIGYAQAMRGEGIATDQLKKSFKGKEKKLRAKYG